MPSINSQNLLSFVTSDYQARRIQNTDPNRFTKTVLQISDQQSRDKYYEKGLEWLRTYVASLQAKLNALVEELNNIYEGMLTEGLYKRGDTKDTAKLLNKLPNADTNSSCSSTLDYNPKDLEITPYDQNVKFYQYNPLFGSRAVDMANAYNESNNDNRDTSIARVLYEADAGVAHRELGASGLATLNYLWMWDLDRINSSYATTKDSFIDEAGVLHVQQGDPRATASALASGKVVEDPTLNVADGADPNKLQVNVTDLQPNRKVFLPDEENTSSQVDLLKVTVEEKNPLAGWITNYDHSGSAASGATPTSNPEWAAYWEGLNQWGIDDTTPITNNPFPPGVPPATYSTVEPAGYQSRRSFHFGNTKTVTYGGVTYAPHSNYIFEPEFVNEPFTQDVDNNVPGTPNLLNTKYDPTNSLATGWTIGGYTGTVGNDGVGGVNTSARAPYIVAPEYDHPLGATPSNPSNTLDFNYFYAPADVASDPNDGDVTIRTPNYNMSDFENISFSVKSYYRVNPYGQKLIHDVDNDYGDSDFDLEISERATPSVIFRMRETNSGAVWFQSPTNVTSYGLTFYGYSSDPRPSLFYNAPNPYTNGNMVQYSYNVPVGTTNMGITFESDDQANPASVSYGGWGALLGGVDFKRGLANVPWGSGLNTLPLSYAPVLRSAYSTGADRDTATQWQIDDIMMRGTGFSKGIMISPEIDFTNMQDGYVEFFDRIETSTDTSYDKKQVYYSFDYDENNPTKATWKLLLNKAVSAQPWQKNEVEIPCVEDQKTVRVKFEFDTRRDMNSRQNTVNGTNFNRDTDHDGWNIDDIRIFGNKLTPTDFYYYRQNLDSEFVTGLGPKLATALPAVYTGLGADTQAAPVNGVYSTLTPVPVVGANPPGPGPWLTNRVTGTTSALTNAIEFFIDNPISTVSAVTNATFNVATADIDNSQAVGRVIQTLPNPALGIYGTLIGGTTLATSRYVTTNYGDGLTLEVDSTAGLAVGQDVVIGNNRLRITAISGLDITVDSDTVTAGNQPFVGFIGTGSGSNSSHLLTEVALPATRDLFWDVGLTNAGTGAALTGTGFTFRSQVVKFADYPGASGALFPIQVGGVSDNLDPYKDIYFDPDIQLNDGNGFAGSVGDIEMINNEPRTGFTYAGSGPTPKSSGSLSNINLTTASSATLTFDHEGAAPTFSFARRVELVKIDSTVVTLGTYDLLSPGVNPESIDLTPYIADINAGGKIRFRAEATDPLRAVETQNIDDWIVTNVAITKSDSPPSRIFTSERTTGEYYINQGNTKMTFNFQAIDDPAGRINNITREVFMETSSSAGGPYTTSPTPIFTANIATGTTPPAYTGSGPISVPTGQYVRFKLVTTGVVPSNTLVPTDLIAAVDPDEPETKIFAVRDIEFRTSTGDGYNLPESASYYAAANAGIGATSITLATAAGLVAGNVIKINGQNLTITSIAGNTINFNPPLTSPVYSTPVNIISGGVTYNVSSGAIQDLVNNTTTQNLVTNSHEVTVTNTTTLNRNGTAYSFNRVRLGNATGVVAGDILNIGSSNYNISSMGGSIATVAGPITTGVPVGSSVKVVMNRTATAPSASGTNTIFLSNTTGMGAGDVLTVGGSNYNVQSVAGPLVTLVENLTANVVAAQAVQVTSTRSGDGLFDITFDNTAGMSVGDAFTLGGQTFQVDSLAGAPVVVATGGGIPSPTTGPIVVTHNVTPATIVTAGLPTPGQVVLAAPAVIAPTTVSASNILYNVVGVAGNTLDLVLASPPSVAAPIVGPPALGSYGPDWIRVTDASNINQGDTITVSGNTYTVTASDAGTNTLSVSPNVIGAPAGALIVRPNNLTNVTAIVNPNVGQNTLNLNSVAGITTVAPNNQIEIGGQPYTVTAIGGTTITLSSPLTTNVVNGTQVLASLNVGSTTVNLASTTGLAPGQLVTIKGGTYTVTAVNPGVSITISPGLAESVTAGPPPDTVIRSTTSGSPTAVQLNTTTNVQVGQVLVVSGTPYQITGVDTATNVVTLEKTLPTTVVPPFPATAATFFEIGSNNKTRANISFDPRRTNIDGKYTNVNDRVQIQNTDYPIFTNTLLSYVEQDASIGNKAAPVTTVSWLGDNDDIPARVIDYKTGLVKNQVRSNFLIKDDGLSQIYQTDANGNATDFYVDDAGGINTGRLVKTTNVNDIDTNKTGWINAGVVAPNTIWVPNIAGTKYEETTGPGTGTYKSMSIWGKRTFLMDTLNAGATLTTSSNDDAYLYVNGYNVMGTAVERQGGSDHFRMVDNSDFVPNEYVLIAGEIARVNSIGAGPFGANNMHLVDYSASFTSVDPQEFSSTTGQPISVLHADVAMDGPNVPLGSDNPIRTTVNLAAGATGATLTSVNSLSAGQTIIINGQSVVISTLNTLTNVVTFSAPLSKPYLTTDYILLGTREAKEVSNTPSPGGALPIPTNVMTPVPYSVNVKPLLRVGFNTVGFKGTEDRGSGEGVRIIASNITAIGETRSLTGGASGIDTDSRWAVKVAPKGYDGVAPILATNEPAAPLSASEVQELFKTEKPTKKELTVNFVNTDKNGVGKLSHIKSIQVTAAGEPIIQTFKTTNYSTDSLIDGSVITQLTRGSIRGVAQTGLGDSLVFDSTTTINPDAVFNTMTSTFAPAVDLKSGLRYTTDSDGKADINLFFEADDNVVNDATLMVKVDYYEDSDSNGIIDGDTNNNGVIEGAEVGTLKTRYIGMQDLRNNIATNPKSTTPAAAILQGLGDRYKLVKTTTTAATALNATAIQVANVENFNVGDYIRIQDGLSHQAMVIAGINKATNTITFTPGTYLAFATTVGTSVTSNNIESDVNLVEAQTLYGAAETYSLSASALTSASAAGDQSLNLATVAGLAVGQQIRIGDEFRYVTTITGTTVDFDAPLNRAYANTTPVLFLEGSSNPTATYTPLNLSATKGRSGGADVTGYKNQLTTRLKQILDSSEYTDMLKYGLLSDIYIAATVSDNRGDQVVGKIVLDFDWKRKRIAVVQGAYYAVYKS